jgi:hypothetical protein
MQEYKLLASPGRPKSHQIWYRYFDTMDAMNCHNVALCVRRHTKSLWDVVGAAAATGLKGHANEGALKREVVV